MADKQRKDTQKYDLRRLFKSSGKGTYQLEERLNFWDTIADAKDQES